MKIQAKAFFMASALLCFICAEAASPFKWTWELEGSALNVKAEGPEASYLYEDATKVDLKAADGKTFLPVDQPKAISHDDPVSGGKVQVYELGPGKSAVWRFDEIPSAAPPLSLTINAQGCGKGSDGRGVCYMPESIVEKLGGAPVSSVPSPAAQMARKLKTGQVPSDVERFIPTSSLAGYADAKTFLKFLKGKGESDIFAGRGIAAIFLLALLGGLALNLTPCVLPMIPVNLAIIGAGAGESDKLKALSRGLLYGTGIAAAYGALGLLAAIGGVGFGQINSAWWFNLGVGVVFALLALAMFGVFEFDLSRFGSNIKTPSGAKLTGVFLLGVVSALLAGACVAPVVVATLLQTARLYSEGLGYALLLPFALGVGMALPWPLAAAGLAAMPKPGVWMLRVKQGLGVLVALLALYYLWLGGGMLLAEMKPVAISDASPAKQVAKLEEAFKLARADRKPILVDFWASWCKNCSAMEATTFKNEKVVEALKGFHVVKFQAENPSEPMLEPWLKRYKVEGLPSFVILEEPAF